MNLIEEPIRTFEKRLADMRLPDGAAYVYGSDSAELRNQRDLSWFQRAQIAVEDTVRLSEHGSEIGAVRGAFDTDPEMLDMYDDEKIAAYLNNLASHIYLDITALTHSVWISVVRAAVRCSVDLTVIYLQPNDYRRREAPEAGRFYDLSDSYSGISALPGFLSIPTDLNAREVLVPLLGFEGHRLVHMRTQVEMPAESVHPIVGLPGFRPEFHSATYAGNRGVLEDGYIHRRVRFARANCPFEAFHRLVEIRRDTRSRLRIALVGTKPHALGAVLFTLALPDETELIYDHPIRSSSRTSGYSSLCFYSISEFVSSELYRTLANSSIGEP